MYTPYFSLRPRNDHFIHYFITIHTSIQLIYKVLTLYLRPVYRGLLLDSAWHINDILLSLHTESCHQRDQAHFQSENQPFRFRFCVSVPDPPYFRYLLHKSPECLPASGSLSAPVLFRKLSLPHPHHVPEIRRNNRTVCQGSPFQAPHW